MLLPAGTGALADTLLVSPVAASTQESPIGGRYVIFGHIDIDSRRRVLFIASVTTGRVAIMRAGRTGVEPLIVTGDMAPEVFGGRFITMVEVTGNAADQVAFVALSDFQRKTGLFLLDGNKMTTIAVEGAPAPGLDAVFVNFNQIRILEAGDIYFSAILEEADGFISGGVFRSAGSGLEPVIVPGDRGIGDRVIEQTIQYDVNEQGEIGVLARITSGDFVSRAPAYSEVLLFSGGRLLTLASAKATLVSGGFDRINHFAITFDQVHIDAEGIVSFYAATQQLPLGGIYYNKTGELYDNHKVVAQGDPSPLSPSDEFLIFGTFGFNSNGAVVYQTVTFDSPFGSFFVEHSGRIEPVALTGRLRPDGLDIWHGFLLSKMNDSDAFVFTDFFGLVQLAVYLGRVVPEPLEVLGIVRDTIRKARMSPSSRATLMRQVRMLDRAVRRNERRDIIKSASSLRTLLSRQEASGQVSASVVDVVDPLLEDLLTVLAVPVVESPRLVR